MPDRILITTDDLEHAVRINAGVEAAGFHTTLAHTLDEARQALRRDPPPDCVVVTGGLHESGAAQLLTLARDRSVSTLGLVEETEPDAKGLARRLGLTGYLEKPADPAEVAATVRRLIERRKLQQRTGIIGESPAIQEVLVKIEQMAPVSSTVLIEGGSGTGKELVARAIHDLSPRRAKPFIAVNCAAIPDTLLESELFGHEKGAFTGAAERRLGRFELADGGTIFLDEVGEMAPATQVKVLRVLEDRTFFRVGGTQPIKVDVRVTAATNKSLKEQVALGRFRDDLFYRLNVLYIYLPPLRERRTDLPLLLPRFLAEFAAAHAPEVPRRRIEERPQRVEVIEVGHGAPPLGAIDAEPAPTADVVYRPGMTMADVERAAIEATLRETKGNRRRAAEILGIGERTLYRKIKEYALA